MKLIVCLTVVLGALVARPVPPNTLPQTAVPPPSAGHALVYVEELDMVVLVNAGLGGMMSPAESSHVRMWGWNGDRWRIVDASANGPTVRNLAGVAYDAARRTLVMHGGGYSQERTYGDTWEWTSSGGWRRFSGAGPGVRDHTQMAFDAARRRCVLFGGQANETTPLGDTWEFDGTAWTRVATSGPSARVHHAMAYDAVRRQVVLFGGTAPGRGDLGDTWAWNGTNWRQLAPAIAPRTHASMAFQDGPGQMMLIGDMGAGASPNVLTLREETWSPLAVTPAPPARFQAATAYDLRRKVLVLFGGGQPNGMDLLADTWEFDGARWRQLQ